jgi:hypothetical protein
MKEGDDFLAELERLDRFLSDEEAGERPIDVMRAAGMEIPCDGALDDLQLCTKLWEIIEAMAAFGFVLEWTDHLSDRDLYRFLVEDALLVEELLPGTGGFCHISPIGGWSNEDMQTHLRYYADDADREKWRCKFGGPLPPHEPLPYDRDRFLPGFKRDVLDPPDVELRSASRESHRH